MMRRLPIPAAAVRLLMRPLPYAARAAPLRDHAADAGLFGPGSVTWRVMREPLLMLAAGRALLMQAANPLVAQGAIDHSAYRTDPYGRLHRTIEWVTVVAFGTTAEAERITAQVVAVHRRVQGTLPAANATARLAPGAEYSAQNAALLKWVHASFVDTMLTAHDALVGGLDDAARDAFVREWDAVAALMGLPRRRCWRDAADLRRYVAGQVEQGPAHPGAGSREVAATVLHPPVRSAAMRPAMDLLGFIAVGLLPGGLRRGYGVTWTPAHATGHAALTRSIRAVAPALPQRMRISPVHDLASARAAGRWPSAQAA